MLTKSGSLLVRRVAKIPNDIMQWSKNRFAPCDSVVIDDGIAFTSFMKRSMMTNTYWLLRRVFGSGPTNIHRVDF